MTSEHPDFVFIDYDGDINTRAVPDVPELVRYDLTFDMPFGEGADISEVEDGDYVLYSQAAEIIRSMIPRVNNCGRYIAERNDGTLMYLNHGNTWQGCDNFIAAKDKEIDKLKRNLEAREAQIIFLEHRWKEGKDAEAKLAQYEAQEPYCWIPVTTANWIEEYDGSACATKTAVHIKPIKTDGGFPLYVSPVPAADLKAENEKMREALKPFAKYMENNGDGRLDLNNKNNPLPDADKVGWIYLTYKDFRRAEEAFGNKNA